jgi:hydrogenase maturation protein HypF
MVRDVNSVYRYTTSLSPFEKQELTSFRRPIVLLSKKSSSLPDSISPGLHNLGMMLPYAGVHHLLFKELGDIPLIYTSGNYSDLPMAIKPVDVINQLNEIVDGYLIHNREIYQRVDDSVIRLQNDHRKLIRRSRGYIPEYIPIPYDTKIKGGIAVGPELSSTGLIAKGYRLFPTQHIGNVDNFETFEFLKDSIFHLKSLVKLADSDIDFIAMDLHPQFQSSRLANIIKSEMKISQSFSIQHHFAHAASLMVDNKINKEIPTVVSTLDGVGYGLDGNVWGGEVIKGTYDSMTRSYHMHEIPMVGGDLCVKYPPRMVMGYLFKLFGEEEAETYANKLGIAKYFKKNELQSLISSFRTNENIAYTSSCGRLLDSIANLLSVCSIKHYRGEPAMRLEGLATTGNSQKYDFHSAIINHVKVNPNKKAIPSHWIIRDIINLKLKNVSKSEYSHIAASSLFSIGKIFAFSAFQEAMNSNTHHIGLSGGVAYNDLISTGYYKYLEKLSRDYDYLVNLMHHDRIPPGDAGISVGQAAIAISKIS